MTRDLTDLVAKRSRIGKSEAAEEVGQMVHQILQSLKNGQPAAIPGLGRFEPGTTPKFKFEKKTRRENRTTRG